MRGIFIATLCVVLLLVGYVCWHLWRITPMGWPAKLSMTMLFLLWMGIAIVGIAFTERFSVGVATVLYEVGHPWLIAFLYLLLTFVAADLAVLCRLLPRVWLNNSAVGLATVVGIVAVVMVAGGLHYGHKYREELTITTDKPLPRPLTIVLASDLHIGYHNRRAELARWIDLMRAEKPDLVLIGGDIIDRSLRPVVEGRYGEEFRRIGVPVWTVLGNHEYFSDVEGARQFFAQSGIRLLRDESAEVEGIRVIGRDDRTNLRRKPLAQLADTTGAFTILLDHQPHHLEEAAEAGIDFQFSGHTHRGQVWPLSWITDAIYEKSWGHHVRGNTRYYISSGLGIWGPKIRVGTRSEYLVLHIRQRGK